MAQRNLIGNELASEFRGKIEDNFTELYATSLGLLPEAYNGLATTTTTPTIATGVTQWWLASGPGTYTNFGELIITGNFAILSYSGTEWTKYEQTITAPNVAQTTGTSTTDVMSQKAVSDNVYFKSNYAVQWKHVRGDSEYVGDNYSEYVGVGVGVMSGNGAPTFNQIKVPFYCLPDGYNMEYKIRVGVKTYGDWDGTIDSLTSIEDFIIPGSKFNKDPNGYQIITLSADYTHNNSHSLAIIATPVSGTIPLGIRNWALDMSSNPVRSSQYSYNDNTGFESGKSWTKGFGCVPPILLNTGLTINESEFLKGIKEPLSNLLYNKQDEPLIDLALPSNIYIAIGRELNIWNDALALAYGPNLRVQYSGGIGMTRERGFRLTPSATGVYPMNVKVKDLNNKIIAKKSFNINSVAKNNGSGSVQILNIGDSLIAAANGGTPNAVVTEMRNLIVNDGGITPLLIGTQNASPNRHEGRGGWSYTQFLTAYETYGFKFLVSGITTTPLSGDIYTNNGCYFQVDRAKVSGGTGYVIAQKTSGTSPSASGTLTKSSGTGDATIAFSSSSANEPLNPFWFNGAINFKSYMAEWANFGGTDAIDFVCINLGLNDLAQWVYDRPKYIMVSEVEGIITNIKSFVNLLLNATTGYPNAKIILGLEPISCLTRDAFAVGGVTNYDKENSEWMMRQLWKRMIAEFDNNAFSSQVRLAIPGLMVDRTYGYERSLANVSARDAAQIYEHINAVHPSTSGYYQMADAYYSSIRGWL